jgi:hypothetical protein
LQQNFRLKIFAKYYQDFRLKYTTAMKLFSLTLSGSYKHPRPSENAPSQNCAFQPVITKPAEKSMKMKVWGLDVIFGNQYGCPQIIRHGGLEIDGPC